MSIAAKEKLQARIDQTPTRVLIDSLLTLETYELDEPHVLLRAKLIVALETRYPEASDAVQDAFEAADAREVETGEDVPVDYVAVLVAAIPEAAKQ